jgi:hypothetical protein
MKANFNNVIMKSKFKLFIVVLAVGAIIASCKFSSSETADASQDSLSAKDSTAVDVRGDSTIQADSAISE